MSRIIQGLALCLLLACGEDWITNPTRSRPTSTPFTVDVTITLSTWGASCNLTWTARASDPTRDVVYTVGDGITLRGSVFTGMTTVIWSGSDDYTFGWELWSGTWSDDGERVVTDCT